MGWQGVAICNSQGALREAQGVFLWSGHLCQQREKWAGVCVNTDGAPWPFQLVGCISSHGLQRHRAEMFSSLNKPPHDVLTSFSSYQSFPGCSSQELCQHSWTTNTVQQQWDSTPPSGSKAYSLVSWFTDFRIRKLTHCIKPICSHKINTMMFSGNLGHAQSCEKFDLPDTRVPSWGWTR